MELTKLRITLILFAGVFYNLVSLSVMQEQHSRLIIIGAGAAGISAAARLLDNNFTDFIILEAEDRIGGRIHSVKFGNSFVDLGAEFYHGPEYLIYELAKEFEFFTEIPSDYSFIYSNGKYIDADMNNDINQFIQRFDTERFDTKGGIVSKGEVFSEVYNKRVLEKYHSNIHQLSEGIEAIPTVQQCLTLVSGCYSLNDTPLVTNSTSYDDSIVLSWNGYGFKTIIDIVIKAYPDPKQALPVKQKIKLNKEVSSINYSNWNTVVLKCKDGSKYTADLVLMTPSIGVLKDNHRTLFYPELPGYKQECIEKIGSGYLLKVALHFPEIWWHNITYRESFIWKKHHLDAVLEKFPAGKLPNNEVWITSLFTIEYPGRNPNVMVAWFMSDIISEIEKLPDQIIQDGIMVVLRQFFSPKHGVKDPDDILISRWVTNPHFRGISSHKTIDALKTGRDCFEDLSQPLNDENGKPVILFGGEATNSEHHTTVQGAIGSGFREADRIMKILL